MNPPKTFMLLNRRDIKPKIFTIKSEVLVMTNIEPIITMPEIAFVPDMRGVCNVGGIFFISS